MIPRGHGNINKMKATVRSMCESDAAAFDYEYTLSGEVKSGETFTTLYARQRMKKAAVYVAEFEGKLLGYVVVCFEVTLQGSVIVHIEDLFVLPLFRKCGVGASLLDFAEGEIERRFDKVHASIGIGAAYGAAQRLFIKRGYLPDGQGARYNGRILQEGAQAINTRSLCLKYCKELKTLDENKKY